MKLFTILNESINFGKLQSAIYTYVIDKMKLSAETKSYASQLAKGTDQFWVNSFDDALSSLEKYVARPDNRARDIFFDSLAGAIVDVSDSIVDYFGNPMNHPPGYKVQKLEALDIDDPTSQELLKIAKEVAPQLEIKAEDKTLEEALREYKSFVNSHKSTFMNPTNIINLVDKLLANVNHKTRFSKVYDDFLGKHPDSMDLIFDDVFESMKVKTIDELMKKAF